MEAISDDWTTVASELEQHHLDLFPAHWRLQWSPSSVLLQWPAFSERDHEQHEGLQKHGSDELPLLLVLH